LDATVSRHVGVAIDHAALNVDGTQRTASTTLTNSTNMPSPVVLTMQPQCSVILGSTSSLQCPLSWRSVPSSSARINRL
jgi:hypothetical protein